MSWHEDRLTNYDNLTLFFFFFFYDAARCFGFPAYDFLPGPGKRDYSRPHLVSERETYFRLFLFFLTMFSLFFSCIIAGVSRGKALASHNHISLFC
jgi:hypothetical protein